MTFTTTADLIAFIQKTHTMFGERETNAGADYIYGIDHTAEYINKFEEFLNRNPAAVGGCFHAHTNEDHGNLNTYITLNRKDGVWEYVENIIR